MLRTRGLRLVTHIVWRTEFHEVFPDIPGCIHSLLCCALCSVDLSTLNSSPSLVSSPRQNGFHFTHSVYFLCMSPCLCFTVKVYQSVMAVFAKMVNLYSKLNRNTVPQQNHSPESMGVFEWMLSAHLNIE